MPTMMQGLAMTSGVFDLLHAEHIEHLRECKSYGKMLIVAINSDESVHRRKGRRPEQREQERRAAVQATGFADRVVIFDDPTPMLLIVAWKPEFFIVGSDYTPDRVAGRDYIEAYGGKVICRAAPRTMSTSQIREQLEKERSVNAASRLN